MHFSYAFTSPLPRYNDVYYIDSHASLTENRDVSEVICLIIKSLYRFCNITSCYCARRREYRGTVYRKKGSKGRLKGRRVGVCGGVAC